jgi:hypothetical protein
MGGRFCRNCGVPQAEAAQADARIETSPGAASHSQQPNTWNRPKKRRNFPLWLVAVIVFLFILGGAGFAAYKYFLSDIPWDEVVAVIRGHRSESEYESRTVPLSSEEIEEMGIDAPDEPPADDPAVYQPPFQQYSPSAPDSMPYQSPPPQPTVRYIWSQTDTGGFSQPVAVDQNGLFVQSVSFSGTVMGDHVRVRSAPNTSSYIKSQFNKGAVLDVIQRYSSGRDRYFWYKVVYSGQVGWMYGEFLSVMETPTVP